MKRWIVFTAVLALLLLSGCSDDAGAQLDSGSDTGIDTADDADVPPSDWVVLSDEDARGAFLSAWGTAPDDVYIAGGQPDGGIPGESEGTLLHWDGDELSEVEFGFEVPLLNWVYGVDDELWVVGNEGFAAQRVDGEWVDRSTPVPEPLWGVWGSASDDLWAVGGDPFEDSNAVILRWGGQEWEEVAPPAPDRSTNSFFKVWGTSDDNIYIVGARGAILHWDGEELTQETEDDVTVDLVSLWGSDEDTIMISGGRGNGTLVFRDDEGWVSSGVLPVAGLNGTWMSAVQPVAYSVGERGVIVRVNTETRERTQERSGTTDILHGVFGFEDGPLFAVGGTLGGAPPWEGVILMRPEF